MAEATAIPSSTTDLSASPEGIACEATITDAGPALKRITITVPADVIREKLDDSMGVLAGTAAIPGFRKGKAPRALLERRFGASVRQETRNQIISEAFSTTVQRHGLEPVGDPQLNEKPDDLELSSDRPLVFSLDIEVVPDFELPATEGLAIDRPVLVVTDEMIEAEITRQKHMLGRVEEISDGFQPGDRFLGPGTVTIEGETEPFFRHDRIDVMIPQAEDGGRGQLLGIVVEDLASRLAALALGDTLTLEMTGPDMHEVERIRGKTLHVEIQLREGQRLIPATVDEVIERYGLEGEAMLREQVRYALEQRVEGEQRQAMREQVARHLSGAVDFPLPERMSESQASRLLEQSRLDMLYKGELDNDAIEHRLAELRSSAQTAARQRLKMSMILHRLAKKLDISVTQNEINGRIAALAMQRGERPEKLRQELAQSGAIQQVALQVRDHKTLDRILASATLTDIPAEEWNRRLNEAKAAEAGAGGSAATTPAPKKSGRGGSKTSGT